ncbi:LytR family transcriptional attenuator [Xylanimonas ulmi]|uniref:LytR family transcriptional attenuator n=2 Tax=Xylanimonas ulmi TaxID=228973 RepID=A0A4Q7M1I8_9MICO|nr:LytR family transcriptional attenuator [Xylanibacterium ulmi]
MTVTGVLAFVGGGAAAAYVDLRNDITVSDVDSLLGQRTDRPTVSADPDDPFAGQALNILVMGTDYRGEGNDELAGAGDEFHSDTTLLVHVAGDRSRIEVVSIPRDSLVDIPACPLPGGGESPPRRDAMFNTAFAIGGGDGKDVTGAAACTILTVEDLTGVPITDHFVVKMTGVIGVVDALGGVPMCLPEPVRGVNVDLDLPAGRQTLSGYQAINFLRARKGHGMGLELGSDLERIKRQQAFLDSTLRTILAQNLIMDSPRLYSLVEAVLRSISTSPELASPRALAGLAWSLRGVDPGEIVFTPLPVVDSAAHPGRVEWVTSQTDPIWERIAADRAPGAGDGGDGAASTPTPGDTAPPGDQTPGDQTPPDQTPPDPTSGDQTPGETAGDQTPGGTDGGVEVGGGATSAPTATLLPGVCPP